MRTKKTAVKAGVVGLLTTAVASFALVAAPAGNAAEDPTSSPEAYSAWLSSKASSGDSRASNTLSQYKNLSVENQNKFLTYLKDPSITQDFIEVINKTDDNSGIDPQYDPITGSTGTDAGVPSPFPSGGETPASANAQGGIVSWSSRNDGDVEFTATAGTTAVDGTEITTQGKARAGDWHAWYKVNDKFLGIKVTEVKIWVDYRSSTSKVTKIYNAGGSHFNYVPFSSFTRSPMSKWISAAGNANVETVWTGKLTAGPEWSARERMWANETGFLDGYLK
ncbi:hypothetical protein [Streptomyces sp. CA-251251]|uniref:hypothetical protein n=1 Tax=Streptomyces sp. CA-251251 TaxID=3240063 RepID=UPI003D8AEE07